ncbi:MAG: C10 family peptidase, partial [Candidatus Eisenbacteria bacterium]
MSSLRQVSSLAAVFAFLFLLAPPASAEQATIAQMTQVCENWLAYVVHGSGSWAGSTDPSIAEASPIMSNGTVLAQYFSISPKGYVVVPVLMELPPVKAYSEEYQLDFTQEVGYPQLLREVLESRIQFFIETYGSLDAIQPPTGDVLFGREHRQEWDRYAVDSERFLDELGQGRQPTRTTVGPLLTSSWDQGPPYNMFCPTGDGGQTVVGCVATAAAQ